MRFKRMLSFKSTTMLLFCMVLMLPQSAGAGCFSANTEGNSANPFNSLVLNAAAMLLPKSSRPAGLAFSVDDLSAIKPDNAANERSRERIVSSLLSSSWLLNQAGRHSKAAATLHHLRELLGSYEDSGNLETRRDTAFIFFETGQLLAEFGDKAGAKIVIRHIRAERSAYETRAGVYPTARALIDILTIIGESDGARTELHAFADRLLEEFQRPGEGAWAIMAVVNTAAVSGLLDEANRYFGIGKQKIPAIEDSDQRKSMELLYARFENSLRAIAAGVVLKDHIRAQIDAELTPIDKMLVQTINTTPVVSRAAAFARLIDTVRITQLITIEERANWLDQITEQLKTDRNIADDPHAVLFVVESLSRAGRFSDARLLLNTSCAEQAGQLAFRPALGLAEALVTSNIVIPQRNRSDGLGSFVPLLATGLSNGTHGGHTGNSDPFPRLRPK